MAQILAGCFNCERAYDLFYELDNGAGKDQDVLECPRCKADFRPFRSQFEAAIGGPFIIKEMREADVWNVNHTFPDPDGERA